MQTVNVEFWTINGLKSTTVIDVSGFTNQDEEVLLAHIRNFVQTIYQNKRDMEGLK